MAKILILSLIILLSGCVSDTPVSQIEDNTKYPLRGKSERVRFLVFHYTVADDETSIRLLTQGNVSAHYLVPTVPPIKNGRATVYQLVEEDDIAWHAGVSSWGDEQSLNNTSIGVEIVNPGFTEESWGRKWYPYTEQQIDLIIQLAQDVISRNDILPVNVVGHSDIAPQRKSDPGPLFPWKRLADLGIGSWPDADRVAFYLAGRQPDAVVTVNRLQTALAAYGYQIPQTGQLDKETQAVITAFQMHFRPRDFSGQPDAETEAIALALVEKYRR